MATKKLRLLLLDTNIVLKLLEDGIWADVVDRCDVHLARTVIAEAQYTKDEDGFAVEVDLRADEAAGRVTVFDVQASGAERFKAQFKPGFFTRLDPGELESLVFLFAQRDEWYISSADKVVFRVLGSCNRTEQGLSLEEVLQRVGLARPVAHQFSKAYRDVWSKRGFAEQLNGETFLPACSQDTCVTIARGALVPVAAGPTPPPAPPSVSPKPSDAVG